MYVRLEIVMGDQIVTQRIDIDPKCKISPWAVYLMILGLLGSLGGKGDK